MSAVPAQKDGVPPGVASAGLDPAPHLLTGARFPSSWTWGWLSLAVGLRYRVSGVHTGRTDK